MDQLKDRVVVVTGAASGIGLQLAIQLIQQGAHVALVDVREEGLQQARKTLEANHTPGNQRITYHQVDVSDAEQMQQLAIEVHQAHQQIDILINNAGIAIGKRFAEQSLEEFQKVININFSGVVYGIHAFLPFLKQANNAQIVNVSSIGGYATAPTFSSYSCAKYAVRALSETLWQELPEINVLSVYPGGIRTELGANSAIISEADTPGQDNNSARTSAESAAQQIIKAIKKRRQRLFIGADAKILYVLERITPKGLNRLFGYLMRNA